MQVRKVAVVATGALATAAAMGSTPAFAADSGGTPDVAPAVLGILDYQADHRASDEAMRELAESWMTVTPEQTWSAPWEQDPPQLISVGSGSAVSALAVQNCGSTNVTGAGVAVPVASPNTVLGGCDNGNIAIERDGDGALISLLDGTALSLAPIQNCGSSNVTGLGAVAPIASPNTVGGDCNNGNIAIGQAEDDKKKHDKKKHYKKPVKKHHKYGKKHYPEAAGTRSEQTVVPRQAPWEVDPPQLVSLASGSALSALAVQTCGSSNVTGAGAAVPIASPNTVLGDCNNGNVKIDRDGEGGALLSILDGTAISAAPVQNCGSSNVTGVGLTVPVASPNTVLGDCNNGNIAIG